MTFHRKTSVPTDLWLASVRESVTHHAVSVMGAPEICRQGAYVTCLLKLNQDKVLKAKNENVSKPFFKMTELC